ncbi:uncharacterized protein V1516DRAFT_667363 [Lipomyces oligophaga]|uniref:uncharacterized protein n=1 Tax=Lipomyces oligophaga TaxID=45792 RepID=UPI0034CE0CD5
MSRFYGFFAGVATSSILSYLAATEIEARTTLAGTSMSYTKSVLESAVTPTKYSIVKPVETRTRDSVRETMADLWDQEVEKGAKFVLSGDIERWCRSSISKMWTKLSGGQS